MLRLLYLFEHIAFEVFVWFRSCTLIAQAPVTYCLCHEVSTKQMRHGMLT